MQNSQAVGASLEEGFRSVDSSIASIAERLKAAQAALASATKAAATGDVISLSKFVNQAKAAVRETEPHFHDASSIVGRDYAAAIRSNAFARELIETARSAKLDGVRMVHGVIFSFPVILAPVPEKHGYRIGKKLTRSLRPSAVIRKLRTLRERQPSRKHLERLLAAISEAYFDATRGQASIAVRISDIYERLTRLSQQKADYTELDFIGDLYLLERENILVLPDGRVISFPASTGVRSGNVVRIATEAGQERVYSSVRFD